MPMTPTAIERASLEVRLFARLVMGHALARVPWPSVRVIGLLTLVLALGAPASAHAALAEVIADPDGARGAPDRGTRRIQRHHGDRDR